MDWEISGKTVVITGASGGIGLEASRELARMGARVITIGRDPKKVADYRCDFSSQVQIRRLASDLLRDLPRIDVLVNNAGGVNKRRELTVDGIEKTFATNHLGYFLLTSLLLERIRASAPARIVTVASIGHRRGSLDFDNLSFDRGGYSIMQAYRRSKLANVLFARELARRLAGTAVTSNSVHPGNVATNIWSGAPLWAKPLIYFVLRRNFITPEEGGRTIVQLAASPELENISGKYFENRQPVDPAPQGRDESAARRLWDVSERLTGVVSPA